MAFTRLLMMVLFSKLLIQSQALFASHSCTTSLISSFIKSKFMQSLKNRVHLIGFLGNTPEIKKTENGKSLARFSIATNERFTNAAGEKITETIWHNLIAWNQLADIAEKFLLKGSQVAVEGKLINRSYTDTEGTKRYVTEIQVIELLMLNNKPSS